MKRKMALLLAAILTVSSGLMAYAAEPGSIGQTQQSQEEGSRAEEGSQVNQDTAGTQEPGEDQAGNAENGKSQGGGESTVSQESGSGQDTQASQESGSGQDTQASQESGSGESQPSQGSGSGESQASQESGSGESQPSQGSGSGESQASQGSGNGQESLPSQESGSGESQPSQGSGNGQGTQPPQEGGTPQGTQTNQPAAGNIGGQRSLGPVGQVDVSIGAALFLDRAVNFTVTLTDASNQTRTSYIAIEAQSTKPSRTSFEKVADGAYVLTVKADGFATYTQNIQVEGRAYAVNLMTGFLAGITYEEDVLHPGVLVIGDVNGDGKVDEADRDVLVSAVDKGDFSALPDLNGDGEVNLVDLEYFSKAFNDTRDKQAGIEEFIPNAVIMPAAGDGTAVNGSLTGMLKNQNSVTLSPAAGGAISPENPVTVQFDFDGQAGKAAQADGIIIETGEGNPIKQAAVTVTYMDEGGEGTIEVPVVSDVEFLLDRADVYAERDSKGNIRLHLGTQIAVKRVTLVIREMTAEANLAEISKVEFVNGMGERIPEPAMDIPKNLKALADSGKISVTWEACVNVTGYEVLVKQGEQSETVMVTGNALDLTSFGGKGLTNYLDYRIQVQSVNGTWRSGYGEEVTATPMPNSRPPKPDDVNAEGKYQSIIVSWKDMKDTVSYNVYYKEEGTDTYQKIENISENSYIITGLKDLVKYSVYVTGVNELGESDPSLTVSATTTDLSPAAMPKYKLINRGEVGEKGAHIINATTAAAMKDSPLDTQAGTAWGTVDHDPASYYFANTWDAGGYNPVGGVLKTNAGLLYEFDQAYEMDTFAFHDLSSQDTGISYIKVRYWDEGGTATNVSGVSMQRRTDAQGKSYYVVKLPQMAKIKKLQFGLARYSAVGTISVAEVYFYHYDTLLADILALYEDDLHMVLKPEVNQDTINQLRERINTPDEESGELHPDRELLERELKNAEDILNAKDLRAPVKIHSTITTQDAGRGFGGLNAWQPIGITAAAQDKIMIYVGHNTKRTGESTNLQLVATQYNSEAGGVSSTVATLKVGANKITVPKLWTKESEAGGALYVQYTGNNANDQYAVRVSGGEQVPILDLYQVEEQSERLKRTQAYVEALETYVSNIQAKHQEVHQNGTNESVKKEYKADECILGATDILLDTMMFSLPAQQIWAGSGSAGTTAEERAGKILNSMDAMDEMMYLFYQHKGLNDNAPDVKDRIPLRHLNIRYQRMFAGAFMYASGNHIGIGWGSTSGMVTASPVVRDENGKWQSGSYFGWGIAHEIGHCINQGAYAVAEVTNNYFSVLAQARDTNDSVRFQYDKVYEKVTSGSRGPASNVFTQLAMYWQLHLAYDNGYNYKTYENYEEQLNNLFFARVDTYARDQAKAPHPGNVALTLAGNRDQDLMRLACAAAEKDILDFFQRWGMTPDEGTRAYAGQFSKETRAIYYVNDEARVYRLESGGSSVLDTEGKVEAVGDGVTATKVAANRIDFNLSAKTIPEADILGYEVVRCTISGGKTIRETVGFTTGNTMSDIITTMNNRTVSYEVTVVDKYLNRSAVKTLDPLKIEHNGSLDKTFWTVETQNLKAAGETAEPGSKDTVYCSDPEAEKAPAEKEKLIDNKAETVYTATASGEAVILLDFHKTVTVAGFQYTPGDTAERAYSIEVRIDDTWREVANGTFKGAQTIYLSTSGEKYVSTYSASALKLILKTANGDTVSIGELDVLAPTGDNVDFRRTEDSEGKSFVIGKLAEEFKFGEKDTDVIPKGSIVFAGSYKGSPAYNVVILYDQNGNIVGGLEGDALKAEQIIMADVPDTGNIQDVSDGTWIYWLDPDTDLSQIKKVRAELYRVNKAETNEGQRLVSDSLFEEVPAVLPEVYLDSIPDLQR